MYKADHLHDVDAVAIIGVSCQFPGAKNAESFWKNIADAVESVEELSTDELVASGLDKSKVTRDEYVNRVSRLNDVDLFDADFFSMTARDASITSPSQRLLLQCAYEALEDASYSLDNCTRNIGVFVGANRCDEWQKRLYALSSTEESNGARQLQWIVANDLDYAATRISHKLNLHGPSLNISTACSTSLVAIHQACRSLLSYESDMALAGGANVALEQYHGYLYQYGGIQSSDGFCRAFDEQSDGTLFGSGAGVVLLKRLDEALADGDHIYGIIRGSAINNDGSAKVGFTAPSVTGQAEVISSALAVADVDPADIELIEAHGTGTSLGDPIEIQALTKAYRRKTKKNQYCAIGSVKTNIGHLGSAAGIAGFIKAVYALKNKTLPPSLHFNKPNPEIDFASSPFYVANARKAWSPTSHARFAGVSSFGVGGTNAHIILQEAPERVIAPCAQQHYVVRLSAKTETALKHHAQQLASFLQTHPETSLRDLAFSLNTGRAQFESRASFVAASTDDAVAQLQSLDVYYKAAKNSGAHEREKTSVCFMFPGQGAQHANMCRDLYETYPVFKQTLDECCRYVEKNAQIALLPLLFCSNEKEAESTAALSQTHITQPALFAVEYAMATLWMSMGVTPGAMIGHSIGEYVAACLAGVFSLEDALRIVCLRGSLMQAMPTGAMLAVALSEDALAPYKGDCELAAVNSLEWCVLSGTEAAIAAAAELLTQNSIFCRRLHTSHAFHSSMMDAALEPFVAALSAITLSPPQRPFVSNLTGQWIKNAEATNPHYWARHLRSTVKFHDGVHEVIGASHSVLLEVGPGQALTSLVVNGFHQGIHVIPSARPAKQKNQHDAQAFLSAVGKLACVDVAVDWSAVFAGEACSRISLPTYPFERKRYWIEPLSKKSLNQEPLNATQTATAQVTLIAGDSQFHSHQDAQTLARGDKSFKHYLTDILSQLLGTRELPTTTPLVELGLNSLMAIELRTKINALKGDDSISVVDLLDETATIDFLSERLAGHTSTALAASPASAIQSDNQTPVFDADASEHAVPSVNLTDLDIQPDLSRAYEAFPLTDIQQAYWIGRTGNADGGNVATYAYIEMNVNDLDLARYQASLNTLIQRHHMLRMVVLENGTQQFLRDVPEYHIPYADLSQLSAAEREAILTQKREHMSHQVLDTSRWPLFEVVIHKTAENTYRLHYGFDFMIVDVLSLMVFFRDLFLIYVGRDNKLEPLELCFRDYVLAEQRRRDSDLYVKSKHYWLQKIDGLPMPPQLPLTKDAAQVVNPKYVRRDFTLDADTWSRLKASAKRYKITPSVLIATAYSEVIRQWSNPQEFTLNLTIFNRPRLHRQMNDLIGDFTSSVLLHVDMQTLHAFSDSAKAIQAQLLMDLEHRLFNGVEVLRALNSSKGGYQSVVMPYVLTSALGLDQYSESRLVGLEEKELQLYEEMMELGHTISQTSQVWLDHVVREKSGCLLCNWDSLEELFPEGLLDDMFCAYYDRLIQLANEGASAWESIPSAHIPAYQVANRDLVNATEVPISEKLLHELFDEAAEKYANNIAIVNGDLQIPYWQLQAASQQLAPQLIALGAKPNRLIAIVMDKGWEQIVAVFGILYAGAAYMPIDAALPRDRILTLLEQGEVSCVLTQSHIAASFAFPSSLHCEVLTVDWLNAVKPQKNTSFRYVQQSTDLAYVLFTSGSTGVPKGVMISHQSAANTVLDINQKFSITDADRAIAINALNFDLSVYDIFGLLAAGGGLVMPQYQRALDPKHWVDLVENHGVTFWNTVPAIVQLYLDELDSQAKTTNASTIQLRYMFMSGDWIPVTLPPRIQQLLPSTLPVSLGGPTETTVWSIYHAIHHLAPDAKSVTYGKPLANRAHYILHKDLTACPDWVTGMIYTGGRIGVAEGYWKDEEKTDQVFIHHPETGQRMYCTGDTGRFLPDGNIEFAGRIDNQVKIQGHRIELGEIEFALRKIPEVQEAIVIPVADYKHDTDNKVPNKLIAFYKNKATEADADEVFSGDILQDPLKIALFKLEQHGLRSFANEQNLIALPAKPSAEQPLLWGKKAIEIKRLNQEKSNQSAALSLTQLGELLSGLAQVELADYSLPKYFYPSAGSAHPIQVYALVKQNNASGLGAGVYYYDPSRHALCLLSSEISHRVVSADNTEDVTLILAAYNPAIVPLYGDIGVSRFSFIETGHIENLLVGCAAQASLSIQALNFDAQAASELIQADENYRVMRVFSVKQATEPASVGVATPIALMERQSYRTYVQHKQSSAGLLQLLKATMPVIKHLDPHALPSLYLYVKPDRFSDLSGGFYRVSEDFSLNILTLVDASNMPTNLQYSRNKTIHAASAFSLIFVANTADKTRHQQQMIAAGYLAQSLQNACPQQDIGLCSTAGVKKVLIAHAVNLLDSDEIIYCLEGGGITPEQKSSWVTESMHQEKAQQENTAMKELLKSQLPYYMVPSAFIELEQFPLTPNGKIDRKTLASFNHQKAEPEHKVKVLPHNALEETLLAIWCKVLELDDISMDDNLFELGGDSLSATKLISEVQKQLHVSIPLHKLFADPTVMSMVGLCETQLQQNANTTTHLPIDATGTQKDVSDVLVDFGVMTETLLNDAVLSQRYTVPAVRASLNEPVAHILLTGATGFLGAYVLRELLDRTSARISCLVRAQNREVAEERLIDNLRKYGLWRAEFIHRLDLIEGDIAQAHFGLSPEVYTQLSQSVDQVYHVASLVNYARAYGDLKKVNVAGAHTVIDFSFAQKLKPVVVISTKYVCIGLTQNGIQVAQEEKGITDPAGMFIGYTQSKWVVEQLFEQAQQQGLPVAILRPGQITAASQGEVVLPQDAFHHLIELFVSLNSSPIYEEWTDGVLDILPVDFAAKTIVDIGSQSTSYGRYFNLVNPYAMTLSDFFEVLNSWWANASHTGDRSRNVKSVHFDEWAASCIKAIEAMEDRGAAYVLSRFFVKTEFGWFIKGLFLKGDLACTHVTLASQDYLQTLKNINETVWEKYFIELKNKMEDYAESLAD